MGVYLTPSEMKDFDEKDSNGNTRKKPEVIKERLGLRDSVRLIIKPSGLSFNEFRSMLNLKSKRYSELTTDQLTILRDKVLFRLENEVSFHIEQWEEKIRQLKICAQYKGVSIEN